MIVVSSYKFHIMIYGNGSDDYSQIVKSIFHQNLVLNNLKENGIFINDISSGESINEFINNTLLLRNDLMVNLETVYESKNKQQNEYFDQNYNINDIYLYVKNKNI